MMQLLKKQIFPFLRYGLASLALTLPFTAAAQEAITTSAEYAIAIDHDSGDILFEKNADQPMKPASMAKIMTSFLAFEQLKDGSLRLDDTFLISNEAYSKGGSRMFVEIGKQVSVEDLLWGIIVQSGNDAAIAVAEGLAGTEDAFAEMMTDKAKELGMVNTVFANSTGWPDPRTTTTARDLAMLAQALIRDYPDYYAIYREKTFDYNNIKQPNRNPLLYTMDAADGLKTGHTQESGYGLVGSAEIDGQRIILVVNGLQSSKERRQESLRLMNLGFRSFKKYDLLTKDEVIGLRPVDLGTEPAVPALSGVSVSRVLKVKTFKNISRRIVWDGDLKAPVTKGQKLGDIFITVGGIESSYPLIAGKSVEQLPFFQRIGAFFTTLIFGREAAVE